MPGQNGSIKSWTVGQWQNGFFHAVAGIGYSEYRAGQAKDQLGMSTHCGSGGADCGARFLCRGAGLLDTRKHAVARDRDRQC